ncbi:MAG: hypothetical protein WBC90_00650, partial [Albidovulum sp.]
IDRFSVTAIKKSDDKCMAISDLGAYALFSAVRRDQRAFGLSETRYLYEARGSFLAGKSGQICGHGIKVIHSLNDLGLPQDTGDFLRGLKNPRREYWRL